MPRSFSRGKLWRVSSAAINETACKTSTARAEISPLFPIGVATIYKTPFLIDTAHPKKDTCSLHRACLKATMQQTFYKISLLSFLTLVLFLTGCVPSTSTKDSLQSSLEDNPLVMQAEALALTGDFQGAATLFEQAAAQFPRPDSIHLLLRAVENYFKGQNSEQAANLLSRIDTRALPNLDFHRQLLVAELALSKNRPVDALNLLATPPDANTDISLLQKYHQLRAESFRLAGNQLESARELSELDLLLEDEALRLENQYLIVETLSTLTDTALELLQPSPPGIQGGWMGLTRIVKEQKGATSIQVRLEKWREEFPSHPALPSLLEGYFKRLKTTFQPPNHIAIMLPSSGPYAVAAKALRYGFLAAYYKEPSEQRPTLKFYDSSNSADTWPLFQEAVAAGAEMIIGPLSKSSVSQLARAGELDIPVLALNQVPPEVTPPGNLFQFGLAPEDEAAQVAERAWLDGHENAVVLTPKGQWGNRIHTAFVQRWEQLGGTLVEHQLYDPKQHDFGTPIQALLNINESKQRKRSLQRLFGKSIKFEPRRRQDAHFIFLAAKTKKARQIRPQLQFHHAAGIPIYGTSHLYSGRSQPKKDVDLEGIKFPDIPWILTSGSGPLSLAAVSKSLGSSQLRYPRLYAMGIDSFELLPHLARLQNSPRESFDGQTGTLYLDGIQQIHRQLVWAEITAGSPKVLGYSPRLDSGLNSMMENAPQGEQIPLAKESEVPKGISPANADTTEPPADPIKPL